MLRFVFGVKVDMRGSGTFRPALDSYLGTITSLASVSKSRVEAITSTGGKVVLTGDFDFRNESHLRDSDITGFALQDKAHHLVISMQGIPNTQLNDFDGSTADWKAQMLSALRSGFSLTSGASDDVVFGLDGNDQLSTGAGDDRVNGGAGNDRIDAGAGDDVLNGGRGVDTLRGGRGDDLFIIDNAKDRVVELAGGGNDTARTSVDWTMAANLEKLMLTGSHALHVVGNDLDNLVTGNAAANRIEGRGGDDVIDGGGGADVMLGGRGNDTYVVDHAGDRVIESTDQGHDTVLSRIDFALPANVEDLTLTGSANIDGTGNDLPNIIHGNAGDNILKGGGGLDTLFGGDGADHFVLTEGRLNFAGEEIMDFASGTDSLTLDHAVFTQFALGVVDASHLRDSNVVGDADDFLVYNQATGVLYYDANSNGSDVVAIAQFAVNTVLLASDIQVAVV